jgi:thiosulfate reductase cytochrome b subunit
VGYFPSLLFLWVLDVPTLRYLCVNPFLLSCTLGPLCDQSFSPLAFLFYGRSIFLLLAFPTPTFPLSPTHTPRDTIHRMNDTAIVANPASAVPASKAPARHSALVRITHWITTLCFFALLVSGLEIVVSHPRFYWGETGNNLTTPLFQIPIPASRALVPTGYGYTMPDQNGWSRYLHFQSAWLFVLTGLLYTISLLFSGHLRKDLLPRGSDLSWRVLSNQCGDHMRFKRPSPAEAWSYNVLQRLTYLFVIFVLVPLMIWSGLAMSLTFVSAFPATVTLLGGEQSARTIHFFVTLFLVLFLLIHVVMIFLAGFRSRMRAMITGRCDAVKERP